MDIKFILYFLVPAVLIVLISILGVVLLVYSARKKKKAGLIEIGDWATIGGKILSVSLDPHQPDPKHAGEDFEPHVEYAYVVNNIEYQGKKVFPGESSGYTEAAAKEILNQYPINGYVAVRYKPQDPADSALQPQSTRMDYITMAGYILTGFGVISCCFTSSMAFIILGAIK